MILPRGYLLIGAGIAALVLIGSVYWTGYRHAGNACDARVERMLREAKERADEELRRQGEANRQALEEARQRADELAEQNDAYQDLLDELGVAAGDDSDADRLCLGVDSVRRLKSISGGS